MATPRNRPNNTTAPPLRGRWMFYLPCKPTPPGGKSTSAFFFLKSVYPWRKTPRSCFHAHKVIGYVGFGGGTPGGPYRMLHIEGISAWRVANACGRLCACSFPYKFQGTPNYRREFHVLHRLASISRIDYTGYRLFGWVDAVADARWSP